MIYKQGTAFSIVLVFTAISILGWFFLPMLSVSLQPTTALPGFTISTNWYGASALTVESGITSKIESAISMLEGVKNLKSVSSKGNSKVEIEIDKFTDMQKFRLELSTIIRRLYPKLPEGSFYPQISMKRIDDNEIKPLVILTLNGPDDSFILQEYAKNNIKTKLSQIAGIDNIKVYGGTGFQWNIKYNESVCNSLGISLGEIKNALSESFIQQSLGRVEVKGDKNTSEKILTVKLEIPPGTEYNWKSIPIKKIDNRIIHLDDIAEIEIGKQKTNSYFRINGQNAINLVIYPMQASNAIELAKEVTEQLEFVKQILPANYNLDVSYNSTEYVKSELNKIYYRTLFTLIILLVFVFLVSLNLRYVLLIVLSLFTNISISFILYYLLGIEIHLYSLAGITVSLGLIIDNSIVMADHLIYRKNIKVYTALLASTLTTVVSLVIVYFLPEGLKLNLWDFSLIIVVNLMVSLLIALFYIPALLSRMKFGTSNKKSVYKIRKLKVYLNNLYFKIINILLKYRKIAYLVLLFGFGIPLFMLPNKVEKEGPLSKVYNSTLGNEWYLDNLRPYVDKYLGGSFRLFSYYVFENSYYSKVEETKLVVRASMPKGASVDQLNEVIMKMEDFVGQYGDQIKFQTKIQGPEYAQITISFNNLESNNSLPYILKGRLIAQSIDMGGVNWSIYGLGKGFSNRVGVNEMVNYRILLKGYNYDDLERQAIVLRSMLQEHPRVDNVNISAGRYYWEREKSYEYYVDFNKNKMDIKNINSIEISSEIAKHSVSNSGLSWLFTGKSYELFNIYPDRESAPDKWEIMHKPMDNSDYKLSEFINIKKQIEQQSIYKENQNYLRIVDYQYIGTLKFGNIFLEKTLKQMEEKLPFGYSAKSMNSFYRGKEETIPYTLIIVLIAIIIFVICSILFESLSRPFAILLTIPASFIGVFLTFYYFDFNFDQGGYASFILISGLVVNSAIYILNEYDNITGKKRNLLTIKNYIKAFNRKIVPILLTISSTVLGLVPFVALGQNEPFWFALAAGTIGGLLFSIIIIVFYLPVFVFGRKQINS